MWKHCIMLRNALCAKNLDNYVKQFADNETVLEKGRDFILSGRQILRAQNRLMIKCCASFDRLDYFGEHP